MTKAECLHAFFAGFGLRAYEENSVPAWLDASQTVENAPPYLTYELATDEFRGEPVQIAVNLWDRSGSWQMLNELTDTISAEIGRCKRLVCDDGIICVTKGSPFAQNAPAEADNDKRKLLHIDLTFITN